MWTLLILGLGLDAKPGYALRDAKVQNQHGIVGVIEPAEQHGCGRPLCRKHVGNDPLLGKPLCDHTCERFHKPPACVFINAGKRPEPGQ